MNCTNNQKEITIGVDTGKFQFDIYIRPLDIYFTVSNDEKGIKNAIKQIKAHKPTYLLQWPILPTLKSLQEQLAVRLKQTN